MLVARLILAGVFAFAGVAKLADLEGSRRAAAAFGLPDALAHHAGRILPLVELLTAALLVPAVSARAAGFAAGLLLIAFITAIALAIARGDAPECHCFGAVHSEPAGPQTLARNALLLGLSLLVATNSAAAAVTASIAGLSVALALDRVVRRRPVPDDGEPVQLEVGAAAPEFTLPSLTAGTISLQDLLRRSRPVLVVFTSAGCGPCASLMPDLAAWQDLHAERLTIAVIAAGDRERNVEKVQEHDLRFVGLQDDREVADAYGAHGTPMAVLVDPDGRVATPIAGGATAIAGLVTDALCSNGRLSRRRALAQAAGSGLALTLIAPGAALAAGPGLAGPGACVTTPCTAPEECCAGTTCYDPSSETCCGSVVCAPDQFCCGGSCFDISDQVGCCHNSTYDPRTEKCCQEAGADGHACFKDEECCGKEGCCSKDEFCCGGSCFKHSERVGCCHNSTYNPKEEKCCPQAGMGSGHACFKDEECCGTEACCGKDEECCGTYCAKKGQCPPRCRGVQCAKGQVCCGGTCCDKKKCQDGTCLCGEEECTSPSHCCHGTQCCTGPCCHESCCIGPHDQCCPNNGGCCGPTDICCPSGCCIYGCTSDGGCASPPEEPDRRMAAIRPTLVRRPFRSRR